MGPSHDSFAPPRASHTQRLATDLALLIGDLIYLTLLLFPAALDVLVLAGRPLLFSALLQELGRVFLKGGHGEEDELVIGGDLD